MLVKLHNPAKMIKNIKYVHYTKCYHMLLKIINYLIGDSDNWCLLTTLVDLFQGEL